MNRIMSVALGALFAGAVFSADLQAGKVKSASCAACHGSNGISPVSLYPNLAGQKAAYLESALKGYRSQQRQGGNAAMMWSMASPLTDTDIADLAAYYASLNPAGN